MIGSRLRASGVGVGDGRGVSVAVGVGVGLIVTVDVGVGVRLAVRDGRGVIVVVTVCKTTCPSIPTDSDGNLVKEHAVRIEIKNTAIKMGEDRKDFVII